MKQARKLSLENFLAKRSHKVKHTNSILQKISTARHHIKSWKNAKNRDFSPWNLTLIAKGALSLNDPLWLCRHKAPKPNKSRVLNGNFNFFLMPTETFAW